MQQMQNPFALFQNTLKDALDKNEKETEKWTKHKEEMIQAETSLREFQKQLQVELMVPIGKKALMPGFMYHTSEVLVGHGSKIFSKCTAQQAIRICRHRQKYADTHLEALAKEEQLHKNKLELPGMQNAFGEQGQEIIEEYDEEQEARWRQERKEKVALARRREAEELRKGERTDDELMEYLDELEMMEELNQEFDKIEVNDDVNDLLSKFLSGEVQPPPVKPRISRATGEVPLKKPEEFEKEEKYDEPEIEPEEKPNTGAIPKQPKDENTLGFWDEVLEMPSVEVLTSEDEEDDSLSEQVQMQLRKIQEECKMFNIPQRRRYLKSKLKDVELSLKELKVYDETSLITKVDLDDLRDVLVDEILRLEDEEEEIPEEEEEEDQLQPHHEAEEEEDDDEPRNRRIKFAKEDSVRFINKFEAPCAVSLPVEIDRPTSLDIDPSVTCQIKFKHTLYPACPPTKTDSEEEEDSIASPIDIYKKFEHCLATPATKNDPMLEMASAMEAAVMRKSILKYKEKVLSETHLTEEKKEKPKKVVRKKIKDVKDVDCYHTFKPVVHNAALRYLFALAVEFDFSIEHLEVSASDDLDMKLFEFGLQQSRYDQQIYFKMKGLKRLIIATYDGILIFCNEKPLQKQIKHFITQNVAGVRERGQVTEFMGITIVKNKDGICLEQNYNQNLPLDNLAWSTRPDIAFLSSLGTKNSLNKYIKGSPKSGLNFSKKASTDITAVFEWSNKFVQFIFLSKGGIISWYSKAVEKESDAFSTVLQEALWWDGMKRQIINDQTPLKIYMNEGLVVSELTDALQEALAKSKIQYVYVPEKNLITKSLMEGMTLYQNQKFMNCLKQEKDEKLLGDVVERQVEYSATVKKSAEEEEGTAKVSKFKANRKRRS